MHSFNSCLIHCVWSTKNHAAASQRQLFKMDSRSVSELGSLRLARMLRRIHHIGVSGVEATMSYIRNQAEHHRKHTFREERGTMMRNTTSECLAKTVLSSPYGTRSSEKTTPALKRWAIVRRKKR